MKIGLDCPECLVHRGLIEICKATSDNEKRIKTAVIVLKAISDSLSVDAVPGIIGTMREKIIQRETNTVDLYAQDKYASNKQALNLLPMLTKRANKIEDAVERFRWVSRLSAIGNLVEFDILGYSVDLDNLESKVDSVRFGIDDSEKALKLAKLSKEVLLLTDNSGEIVFDIPLIEELKRNALSVTVAVKSAPIMNDATMEDAIQTGMDKVADNVIATGQACVGLTLESVSHEFRQVLDQSDLVIAKGMGHYETMTERNWKQPILYLLIAKCRPIASSLAIERGQGAILLR